MDYDPLGALCCVVLCFAVLCCAVLCCAVLCCAVLCCLCSALCHASYAAFSSGAIIVLETVLAPAA